MKYISIVLLAMIAQNVVMNTTHNYSSLAVVTLAGAHISCQHNDIVIKHKRKDCPVCKGKGWYMSGDNIEKIKCQYCEP